MNYDFSSNIGDGITKIAVANDTEEKATVYELFKEGKSNLQVAQVTGISYTKVVMFRIGYEKAHFSGN